MTSIFCDIKIMAKVTKEMDLINILKNTSNIVYTLHRGVKINCLSSNNIGKLPVDAINLSRYELWWKTLAGDLKDFF